MLVARTFGTVNMHTPALVSQEKAQQILGTWPLSTLRVPETVEWLTTSMQLI